MSNTSHLRSTLVMGASVAALASIAAPALAQTGGAPAADQGNQAQVTVIAQHQTTKLQKIPVAVSVFTGASRDRTGVASVQDVTNFAPGFTYDTVTTNAGMRGVTRQSFNVTDDSRVAAYEDEFFVYSPYNLGLSSLFFSQEQIERGPQNVGGRNSEGGSIDMIAVRPTDHPYAEVRATIANYGAYEIEGAASDQIAPGLDARVVGNWNNQGQGYQRNDSGGTSEFHKIDEWHAEGSLDWKPSSNFEAYVRGFVSAWETDEGDAGSRQYISPASWDEVNLNDPNEGTIGGSLYINPNYGYAAVVPSAAAGAGAVALGQFLAGGFPQELPIAATLLNPNVLNNPSMHSNYQFSATQPRTVSLANYDSLTTEMVYHFPSADLKYVGGVQGYDYTLNLADSDSNVKNFTLPGSVGGEQAGVVGALEGFGFPSFLFGGLPAPSTITIDAEPHIHFIENNWWYSHELSFQSTNNGPLQYIVGAMYYYQQYSQPSFITDPQPNLKHPLQVASIQGLLQGNLATIIPSLTPFATGNPANLAAANPQGILLENAYQMNSTTLAGYGQLSYKVTDQFKVTGDIRLSNDRKWGNEEDRDVTFGGSLSTLYNVLFPLYGAATPSYDVTTLAVCLTGTHSNNPATDCLTTPLAPGVKSAGVIRANGVAHRALDATDNEVTGGIGVEWTPTPDIFAYARYNKGYAPLSFNSGFVSASPEVNPEFLNSYEVGYKQSFGRKLTIDVAAFYYDYDQIQLPISVLVNGLLEGQFINFPKAESTGIEFEGVWSPTRDLLFTLSYSYDYTALLTGCNPTTNVGCLVNTQDLTATGPGAHQAAGAPVGVQTVKGAPLPNAPRNKIAVTGSYTFRFDPGNLTLAATYVWRDSQIGNTTFNTPYNTAPSWDDVDLRATWSGDHDRYEVIGFVKNVFNTLQYPTGAGGVALNGNATTAGNFFVTTYNLDPPRTFGVELRYKFY